MYTRKEQIASGANLTPLTEGERLTKTLAGGGGGGVLVANFDLQTRALDKTWKQIDEAPFTVVKTNDGTNHVTLPVLSTSRSSATQLRVNCMSPEDPSQALTFTATSEDGYPVVQA